MSKLTDICPDFYEWPECWMGVKRDLDYGKNLLEAMRPFAEFLAEGGRADWISVGSMQEGNMDTA
jgi:hypothetical protein